MVQAWPGPARADVMVTQTPKGYDIDVVGPASTSEVLDAIANVTGVEIKGTPGDSAVNESHLRSASLERAIRTLLPHAGFVVSSDADGKPTAIIFMAASDDGVAPPPADAAVPDGSMPAPTDGGIPDGGAPDAPLPDQAVPDVPAADAPLPDDGSEPLPDAAPTGTQEGASGG